MKKLIKIIIVLMTISFVTSCDDKTIEELHKERLSSKLDIINYDGHDYIIYNDIKGYGRAGDICHSESCPCKNN